MTDRGAGPEAVPPPGRVLALVGPTASGKSAAALEAAEVTGGEIVAVDAFTVYRGMDVATAKPTPAARRRVPHHLVDVLEPEEECTVRWFQQRARATVAEILARGRLPILVGGSGLYFRAVVDDLDFPPTDPAVRAGIRARYDGDAAAAHTALARLDPAAAARIDPGNLRRTVRALEVLELTGTPFSAYRTDWDTYRAVYADLAVLGIAMDREELDARIATRAEAMVTGGLLDEARRLRGRALSRTARAAIGYGEAFAHLDARDAGAPPPVDGLVEAVRLRTRRYAVRQQRWFARDPRVRWVARHHAAARLTAAA